MTATLEAETVKVKFLRAYRGTATANDYYLAGAVAALPLANAEAVISEGVAVEVDPAAPVDVPAESYAQEQQHGHRPARPARPPAPPRPVFHRYTVEADGPLARVRFNAPFRGRLTGEDWFTAGSVGEFPQAAAAVLVADGTAVPADDAPLDGPSEIYLEGDRPSLPEPSADVARQQLIDELLARAPALLARLEALLVRLEGN